MTTTYFIYSSVIGAKVVELNENGQKKTGYVYANGKRLAKQSIAAEFQAVNWHHANPGSSSWVETSHESIPSRREMDPLEAEVGTYDPWATFSTEPTYEN